MLSPLYTLDQDDTFTGIDKLQVFINRFPNSEYLTEALELMEQLQNKIEKKEFEISKQYYTIRDYSSAIKSLDNFIADNPGTIFREEALYYRWLSQYEIAINSIESRINERVTELERSLENFLIYYPDTIFIDDQIKKFDVIVGMYHDQVLGPIKALYNFEAINITLGLPFLRVSPDHGPNQKMFGKNLSNPESLLKAIKFLDTQT